MQNDADSRISGWFNAESPQVLNRTLVIMAGQYYTPSWGSCMFYIFQLPSTSSMSHNKLVGLPNIYSPHLPQFWRLTQFCASHAHVRGALYTKSRYSQWVLNQPIMYRSRTYRSIFVHEDFRCSNSTDEKIRILRVWWLRGLDSERLSLVGGFFLMFSILCQGCCNLSLYHRERWGSLWCPGWYLFLGIELVILGWLCSSRHLPKLEHQQKQQHRRLDRTSQPLLQGDYRRHDQFRNGLMVWLCFDGLPQSKLQAFPGLPKRDPPVPGRP